MNNREFYCKIKPKLLLLADKNKVKLPRRLDLFTIVNFIKLNSKFRATVNHAECNGYLKPIVYEVIDYNKLKYYSVLGTYSNFEDALKHAIESCLELI